MFSYCKLHSIQLLLLQVFPSILSLSRRLYLLCAVPSIFFHISLQQNDLPGDLAVYFLLLFLYDKTLAISMLTTTSLKPRVLTLSAIEKLTRSCSFIYSLLSTCCVPSNTFLTLKNSQSKVFPNDFLPKFSSWSIFTIVINILDDAFKYQSELNKEGTPVLQKMTKKHKEDVTCQQLHSYLDNSWNMNSAFLRRMCLSD